MKWLRLIRKLKPYNIQKVTMNAVKTATHDVFDAFATLKENGGLGNE